MRTAYPHARYKSIDQKDNLCHNIAFRGTYHIGSDGLLALAETQPPVLATPVHHGEPGCSSLISDTQLADYKPHTDIIVNATAYAPQGQPIECWPVRVRVFSKEETILLEHALIISGPRWWQRSFFGGWRLTRPQPIASLPVRYEHALGGSLQWLAKDKAPLHYTHPSNPIGKGCIPTAADLQREWDLPKKHATRAHQRLLDHLPKRMPAPQIEAFNTPIQRPHQELQPAGFGAIPSHWEPRRSKVGTTDAKWADERAPLLPKDFDQTHYQSAHPGMICIHLFGGGERIEFAHLVPEGWLTVTLPEHRIYLLGDSPLVGQQGLAARLDTLEFDLEARTATLVWRIRIPELYLFESLSAWWITPETAREIDAIAASARLAAEPVEEHACEVADAE